MTVRFGIVGSGRRSPFFLRLTRAVPDRLRAAGVVTRTAERGQQVTADWTVPTARSLDELVAAERPDFVVAAVPWGQMPAAARERLHRSPRRPAHASRWRSRSPHGPVATRASGRNHGPDALPVTVMPPSGAAR